MVTKQRISIRLFLKGLKAEDLWRRPGKPSLDAMISDQPEDIQAMAADIVRRLVRKNAVT